MQMAELYLATNGPPATVGKLSPVASCAQARIWINGFLIGHCR